MTIDYGIMIQQLGPVNNRFRDAEGVAKIVALWNMGDIIYKAVGTDCSLDPVLWEINKRSFITRDVLRYSAIVRKEWHSEEEVLSLFSGVKRYSLFREALPFLKGTRQGVDKKTYEEVLFMITLDNLSEGKEQLRWLKERHIGKTNKKGASKAKVAPRLKTIQEFVMSTIKAVTADTTLLTSLREELGDERLVQISQICYGLAAERPVPVMNPITDEKNSKDFLDALIGVASGNREEKSAFKKLVGAVTLMEWADFFNSARSDEEFDEWKTRAKLSIKVR